jgi:diguanylate cyclase (GGDEF)-like protein
VLFIAAGTLGTLGQVLPSTLRSEGSLVVNLISVTLGIAIRWLPWDAWPHRATLALVAPAFGLIISGQWFNPDGTGTLYGLWFVVVFGWVGTWHPARTTLLLGPVGACAYIVPFLPFSPAASSESLATVVIAVPIAVVMAQVLAVKTSGMRQAHRALEATAELLEKANLTDDLTGVGNRRLANALLDSMGEGDGVIMLDLDHFKLVNDTRGHAEGDRVLMELGAYLLEAVRDHDSVARFGGEEFLVLVRGAGRGLTSIADRLMEGWRARGTGVTLSAGALMHQAGRGPTATLEAVDALLYRAKADGRDRLVTEMAPASRWARADRAPDEGTLDVTTA